MALGIDNIDAWGGEPEPKRTRYFEELRDKLDIDDPARMEAMAVDLRKASEMLKQRQPEMAVQLLENRTRAIKGAGKESNETDEMIDKIINRDESVLEDFAIADTAFVAAGILPPNNIQQAEVLQKKQQEESIWANNVSDFGKGFRAGFSGESLADQELKRIQVEKARRGLLPQGISPQDQAAIDLKQAQTGQILQKMGGDAGEGQGILSANQVINGYIVEDLGGGEFRKTKVLESADVSDSPLASAMTKFYANGTAIQSFNNGSVIVKDPSDNIVTGEARLATLKKANEDEIKLAGLKAGTRKAMSDAIGIATATFKRLEPIGIAMDNSQKGIDLIDSGAQSGVIMSLLPSITSASKQLDALQNRMGLDVLNTTTFGALSAGELKFALDTALPKNLNPKELRQWLVEKKAAQQKLYDYLQNVALYLGAPGNTVTGWIQAQKVLGQTAAAGTEGGIAGGAQDLSTLSLQELQAMRAEAGGR